MTAPLQAIPTLDVFHQSGSVVEVRIIGIPGRGRPYTASGYFNDFELATKTVAQFDSGESPKASILF